MSKNIKQALTMAAVTECVVSPVAMNIMALAVGVPIELIPDSDFSPHELYNTSVEMLNVKNNARFQLPIVEKVSAEEVNKCVVSVFKCNMSWKRCFGNGREHMFQGRDEHRKITVFSPTEDGNGDIMYFKTENFKSLIVEHEDPDLTSMFMIPVFFQRRLVNLCSENREEFMNHFNVSKNSYEHWNSHIDTVVRLPKYELSVCLKNLDQLFHEVGWPKKEMQLVHGVDLAVSNKGIKLGSSTPGITRDICSFPLKEFVCTTEFLHVLKRGDTVISCGFMDLTQRDLCSKLCNMKRF